MFKKEHNLRILSIALMLLFVLNGSILAEEECLRTHLVFNDYKARARYLITLLAADLYKKIKEDSTIPDSLRTLPIKIREDMVLDYLHKISSNVPSINTNGTMLIISALLQNIANIKDIKGAYSIRIGKLLKMKKIIELRAKFINNTDSGNFKDSEDYKEYKEMLHVFFCGSKRFDREKFPREILVDMSIIANIKKNGTYQESALMSAGMVNFNLENMLRERFGYKKIKLSVLSEYADHVHNISIETYKEKIGLILKHVQEGHSITDSFLKTSSLNKGKGQEDLHAIETVDQKGKITWHITQGNHRIASLIKLYELGLIEDIELGINLCQDNEKITNTSLEDLHTIYIFLGKEPEGLDHAVLKDIALQVAKEIGFSELKPPPIEDKKAAIHADALLTDLANMSPFDLKKENTLVELPGPRYKRQKKLIALLQKRLKNLDDSKIMDLGIGYMGFFGLMAAAEGAQVNLTEPMVSMCRVAVLWQYLLDDSFKLSEELFESAEKKIEEPLISEDFIRSECKSTIVDFLEQRAGYEKASIIGDAIIEAIIGAHKKNGRWKSITAREVASPVIGSFHELFRANEIDTLLQYNCINLVFDRCMEYSYSLLTDEEYVATFKHLEDIGLLQDCLKDCYTKNPNFIKNITLNTGASFERAYKKGYYDLIHAGYVLTRLDVDGPQNVKEILSKIFDALTPGGIFIGDVPYPEGGITSEKDLRKLLMKAGFIDIEVVQRKVLQGWKVLKYGRIIQEMDFKGEFIFVGRKSQGLRGFYQPLTTSNRWDL